jgi:uncharacterized repeat protein (TIGR01451 family)
MMRRAFRKAFRALSAQASKASYLRLARQGARRPSVRVLLAVAVLGALGASGLAVVVHVHGNPKAATSATGNLWAWGLNSFGELGATTTQTCNGYACSAIPVATSGIGTVTAVAGGGFHTLAITADGTTWAWGWNDSGQLGSSAVPVCTLCQSTTPVQVSNLPSGVIAVAAGGKHSLALTSSGAVYAWGANGYGQLGDGTTTNRPTPVSVSGLPAGVIAIAAGGYHSLALTSTGAIYAWGDNAYGQLGDGTTTNRLTPVPVSGLSTSATAISANAGNSMALASGGAAYDWGDNRFGQLGDGNATQTQSASPVPVSGLAGVQAISQGGSQGLALTTAGTVYAWGDNSFGELGITTATSCLAQYYCSTTPVQVPGLPSGVTAITAGSSWNMVLTGSGTVWTWGNNNLGELGVGASDPGVHPLPVPVNALNGATALAAGGGHALAIATPATTPPSYGAGSLSGQEFNFDDQQLGGTSAAQTFTLLNAGTAPLTVSGVTLGGQNPGDFSLASNTCAALPNNALQPGASCAIGVSFAPTASGARSAVLTVACDGVNCSLNGTLLGNGINPIASVSPTSLDFGSQPVGTTTTQTVTLSNSGTGDLVVQSVGVSGTNSGSFAVTSPTGSFTVAPGASATISVVFSPTSGPAGPRTASLDFNDNDTLHPQHVPLSGAVNPFSAVSPTSLAFGNQAVGTTSAAQTVTIANTGPATLTITAIASSDPVDFSYTSDPLPITVPGNGSTTLGVSFTPSTTGPLSGTLSITSNGSVAPQTVALSGTGILVADLGVGLSASPSPVKHGASLTYTIAVANHGPTAASGVMMSDTLPGGTVFGSVSTTMGTCSAPAVGGTGTVSCSVGSLSNGASFTVTLVVTVTGPGGSTITDLASVSATSSDPNPANNTATVSTGVYGGRHQ